MFIIRSAFWITAPAFLLPLGDGTVSTGTGSTGSASAAYTQDITTVEALHAAQGTVSDISGFCARQPQVCETGTKALLVVRETAKYGVKKAYEWVNGQENQTLQPREMKADQVSMSMNTNLIIAGASKETTGSVKSKASQNTLRKDDLTPAWGGPAVNNKA